ncbi:hypothetical protein BDY19DRAFT_998956 [Irpex rosettiformis]|uniref:Uncharacterized protein n=1 Tax=Irpex rosettiformis TaxID=378272 RepID=A0ACB8TLV0_9APHY|nr:hypothetical protein BDY19DRAFT_998956 [Irpex rosettiformis]
MEVDTDNANSQKAAEIGLGLVGADVGDIEGGSEDGRIDEGTTPESQDRVGTASGRTLRPRHREAIHKDQYPSKKTRLESIESTDGIPGVLQRFQGDMRCPKCIEFNVRECVVRFILGKTSTCLECAAHQRVCAYSDNGRGSVKPQMSLDSTSVEQSPSPKIADPPVFAFSTPESNPTLSSLSFPPNFSALATTHTSLRSLSRHDTPPPPLSPLPPLSASALSQDSGRVIIHSTPPPPSTLVTPSGSFLQRHGSSSCSISISAYRQELQNRISAVTLARNIAQLDVTQATNRLLGEQRSLDDLLQRLQGLDEEDLNEDATH